MNKYLQISIKCISLILFVMIWNYVSNIVNNPLIFPNVWEVFEAIKGIVTREEFLNILRNTVFKLVTVILSVVILASILSVLSFRYQFFRELIAPYINIIKAIPTVVVIIMALIWYDASIVPIVATLVIIFPILYYNILNGIFSIDEELVKMSKIFNVSPRKRLLELYIPGVYYSIAGGMRSLIGLAFKVTVAGEILSQEDHSIGGEILLNKTYLESSNIFAWVIIVVTLNFLLEGVIVLLNRRLMRWR